MAGEMSSDEKRIRRLEELVKALMKDLASVKDKLGQAAEDDARQIPDDGGFGDVLFRLQSVGVINAASGSGVGSGTARFIQLIGTTRYLLQPFAMGDVTIGVVNDTETPTVNNEYLIGAYVNGVMSLLVGNCTPASPTRAPDPPTS
jgi:hypothetical protein